MVRFAWDATAFDCVLCNLTISTIRTGLLLLMCLYSFDLLVCT